MHRRLTAQGESARRPVFTLRHEATSAL